MGLQGYAAALSSKRHGLNSLRYIQLVLIVPVEYAPYPVATRFLAASERAIAGGVRLQGPALGQKRGGRVTQRLLSLKASEGVKGIVTLFA